MRDDRGEQHCPAVQENREQPHDEHHVVVGHLEAKLPSKRLVRNAHTRRRMHCWTMLVVVGRAGSAINACDLGAADGGSAVPGGTLARAVVDMRFRDPNDDPDPNRDDHHRNDGGKGLSTRDVGHL